MPIKEESFRIGCGRYLQGAGFIKKTGDEIIRLGDTPLIIGGKTALRITKADIEKSIGAKCKKYEVIVHAGTCNEMRAKELAQLAHEKGYNVIVGVGGGVICDFAKLCAYYAKLPIINIPTSSATCAAYTPLSVRYTPDGKTVGSIHYSYEVNSVLVDTEVIITQPMKLFLSGVFDALAKFVEIKQRYTEDTTDYPLGLDYAYVLSKYTFNLLNDNIEQCIKDLESGSISKLFENVVYTAIAATGVISGVARGSNQTAIAHKFYEATRTLYYQNTKEFTHGEIVGVGLLIQNHFNGEVENNEILLNLMRKYDLPSCIDSLNIERDDVAFAAYYHAMCNSSAIESEDEAARLRESLKYVWELTKND
jgi:glycerol dehydrogenase